jgi:hypothetical protein
MGNRNMRRSVNNIRILYDGLSGKTVKKVLLESDY